MSMSSKEKTIEKFLEFCRSENLSKKRIDKLRYTMIHIAEWLDTGFKNATKEDIQNNLLSKTEEKKVIKEKLSSLKDELYHCEGQIIEFDSKYKEFLENLESIKTELRGKSELGAEIKSEIKLLKNKLENATEFALLYKLFLIFDKEKPSE